MSYDRQKVIDLALSQVGYKEKASNSQLDNFTANPGSSNWTKYARDLDKLSNFYNSAKNGYAWCDIFVDWCFVTAYGRAAAQELLCQPDNSAGAGCIYSAQYFKNHGQFHKTNPQPGDQIFFGNDSEVYHTGLVVEVSSQLVTTVEGNSADMVAKRTYSLNSSSIYGYGRPNWGTSYVSQPEPVVVKPVEQQTCTPKMPVVSRGDVNGYVRAMQMMLGEHGYYCGGKVDRYGREDFDGDFGPTTEASLRDFQSKAKIKVTGDTSGETWPALVNI